ncbi:Cell division protein FtsQ [Caenispirillum salinarum AK4]|uniref:Cell division protein FtsQ n=1 Tax=Caenispirillum salinarum AK4 TaxID=1238182 RepID=K9HN75_9PROT|nr:FtsQ-type POTRA domain-containing protein [Caenispirillum salinarum]EKV29996.1 Cell division protein FtsQ [Caenispirillum salinarum AK4]
MRLLSLAIPFPPLPGLTGRTARARAAGRRAPLRRRMPDPKLAALAVGLVALSGSGAWAVGSGVLDQKLAHASSGIVSASAKAGLAVQSLEVEGRNRTSGAAILRALNVTRGDPILALDMQAAREAVESLPWVKEAVVSRRLPGTLHVDITERHPIALWQRAPGDFVLTDGTGTPIAIDDLSRWGHLPVIVGTGAPETAADLFRLLNTEPAMATRVKAATRLGDRRWNLLLDDFEAGITVKLPEHGAEAAWNRLARIEREHGILRNDLAAIDLRMSDRMIVRLNGDGIPPGDAMKGGPDLDRSLPLAPDAGTEA